jgi:hypothetical protein
MGHSSYLSPRQVAKMLGLFRAIIRIVASSSHQVIAGANCRNIELKLF